VLSMGSTSSRRSRRATQETAPCCSKSATCRALIHPARRRSLLSLCRY
jgi:hypothetical protein